MINTNYFNIYNASAGTGKTFSLVRDYLILLFNSKNFELYKNILAITFTNKAVNEMKGRIVRYLINYSNFIDPDEVMIKEITKVSGLTKKEIFSKSSIILKNLLKNFVHKNKKIFHRDALLAIYKSYHLILPIVLDFLVQNLFQLLKI